jgi:hypothetical protein
VVGESGCWLDLFQGDAVAEPLQAGDVAGDLPSVLLADAAD